MTPPQNHAADVHDIVGIGFGASPLIEDTGCHVARVSVVDRCSWLIGLCWPRAECRRRVL